MYSPGGFNATIEMWRTQGVYAKIKLLDHLPKKYTCIMFDRRECGQSGGRVERVTWAHYVAQGKGLLDHLGIERAHIMGGCMGCCPVAAFGVGDAADMVRAMVLYWPVGGAKYRISSHQRFAEHLASCSRTACRRGRAGGQGRQAVRRRSARRAVGLGDQARPRVRESYAKQDVDTYKLIVACMVRTLFDRDTAPGAEPEDLLSSISRRWSFPASDASHATSAARYLEECLPKSEYWDVPVAEQTRGQLGETRDGVPG